jgi:hypothetical protein
MVIQPKTKILERGKLSRTNEIKPLKIETRAKHGQRIEPQVLFPLTYFESRRVLVHNYGFHLNRPSTCASVAKTNTCSA